VNAGAWKSVVFSGSLVSASLFAAAFYLVLVRSDISSDANRIAKLEYEILKAQDVLRALEVTVDDSIQPHVLQARIQGQLTVPREGQVICVPKATAENFDSDQWIADRCNRNGREGV